MPATTKERLVQHETFSIERIYDAAPSRVFAAWADPKAKEQWFGGPDGWPNEHRLDFRVGGREYNRTVSPEGQAYVYDAEYHDIVPNERIVYSYTMDCDDSRMSVSVSTVELKSEGSGTRLVFTEYNAFLDGKDKREDREGGTTSLLESLGRFLRQSR